MSKKVIYPGTFDPITHGHKDIIERASTIFDDVIVGVGNNTSKKTLLTVDERLELTSIILSEYKNVTVKSFTGLVVDFATREKANIILRGVRDEVDFCYELQQASMNKKMAPSIETFYMTPSEGYRNISSSLVREIAKLGGDVTPFVDKRVVEYIWR